jgi:hypothetical protein
VDDALAEQMNVTSGGYASEIDEFSQANPVAAPSVKVIQPPVGARPNERDVDLSSRRPRPSPRRVTAAAHRGQTGLEDDRGGWRSAADRSD